ncbi:MAG TPA: serine hydroxymethyltransferase, partial [Firmicutes bacterium]|nr:serine hydroxymethyltransferase [Bacillota bacterium]
TAEWAKAIDKAIFPGIQGGPLEHVIAGKAVAFGEALTEEFRAYQRRIVENAQVLAEALLRRGFHLVSGGTDNHLMLINLQNRGLTGKEAEKRLDSIGITVNKNTVPNETQSPMVTSGIRVGTPAVTTRGMGAAEMEEIARIMDAVLVAGVAEDTLAKAAQDVAALSARFA